MAKKASTKKSTKKKAAKKASTSKASAKKTAASASTKKPVQAKTKTASKTKTTKRAEVVVTRTHDEIAAEAYMVWLQRGQPEGQAESHWLEAEQRLNTPK